MTPRRIEKVNKILMRELSLLIYNEIFFNSFGIIVTAVDTSSNMHNTKIYIKTFDDGKNLKDKKIIEKLQEKAYYFQQILAQKYSFRYFPKLLFVLDKKDDKILRVESILDKIKSEDK